MKQASKANESVSECSKTELCIPVKALRMLSRVQLQLQISETIFKIKQCLYCQHCSKNSITVADSIILLYC